MKTPFFSPFRPLQILGHRGWPRRFPDNTMEGVGAALEVADSVEVDVRRTGDGVLVLSHDPDLQGVLVAEARWEELRSLDLGAGAKPVALDHLLASVEVPIDLEVKSWPGDPGFEDGHRVALETAERARPGDLLTCFWWADMDEVRRCVPAVQTGLLLGDGGDLEAAIAHARRRGHPVVAPHWRLARAAPRLVTAAAASGIAVVVWTVNDPQAGRELAELGVAAIITDEPDLMAEELKG